MTTNDKTQTAAPFNRRLEDMRWEFELLKQAVRGIAHRGASGDIADVDGETFGIERMIDGMADIIDRAPTCKCLEEG